jgi:Ca-activated chloride channel family protein
MAPWLATSITARGYDDMTKTRAAIVLSIVVLAAGRPAGQQPGQQQGERFRFRTGVELVNVTATVTDRNGRFVPSLTREDFIIYEDDEPQAISHFNSERVPVSLGIVVDTSGSMEGEKFLAAKRALNRFLVDLLDPNDEVFLYRFDAHPELLEGWTSDRHRVLRAFDRISPRGGTALYDAVAEAVPMAQTGTRRKKAIVVISDGNDTSSQTSLRAVQQLIRETEVLVYAIGIDGRETESTAGRPSPGPPRFPIPVPMPFPGRRPPRTLPPPTQPYPPQYPQPGSGSYRRGYSDAVDAAALRDLTDDSGGRTEIIRSIRDLDPATASVADELSKQYFLAYPSRGHKDGRWHTIRVEMRRGNGYVVRARKGYIAS